MYRQSGTDQRPERKQGSDLDILVPGLASEVAFPNYHETLKRSLMTDLRTYKTTKKPTCSEPTNSSVVERLGIQNGQSDSPSGTAHPRLRLVLLMNVRNGSRRISAPSSMDAALPFRPADRRRPFLPRSSRGLLGRTEETLHRARTSVRQPEIRGDPTPRPDVALKTFEITLGVGRSSSSRPVSVEQPIIGE
jgi:hypothetical protein